jgi:hypothetical protein
MIFSALRKYFCREQICSSGSEQYSRKDGEWELPHFFGIEKNVTDELTSPSELNIVQIWTVPS